MINIGAVTVSVLDVLRASSEQLVGDGVKPDGCGWLNGEPNSGVFAPYTVLGFVSGQQRDDTWRYVEGVRAWSLQWRLAHYGASRAQCDFIADRVRSAVADVVRSQVGDYQVSGARWAALGGVLRDDSVNPALWSASDTLILMLDA